MSLMIGDYISPIAAFNNPKNGGLGLFGLVLNSGWY